MIRVSTFALLLSYSSAFAGTTGGLITACESDPGSVEGQICSAYINGLGEGILADQITREAGTAICIPDGVTTNDIREAIRSYVSKKDARVLDLPSGGVVAAAMQATYPCR